MDEYSVAINGMPLTWKTLTKLEASAGVLYAQFMSNKGFKVS